jgi:hypothetical protein
MSDLNKAAVAAAIASAKEHRQKRGLPENCVIAIAAGDGREYIMPEDITQAFETNDPNQVRLDVLEVLGNTSGYGAEDRDLCAFIAYKGPE